MPIKPSRRTLLRGAGAALSLPWLESVGRAAPSGGNLTEPPLRMGFIFMPNGVRPDHWTPPGDGPDYEITPHLQALAPYKNDFLLLENLWNRNSIGRNGHWPKVPIWLSGGYVQRTTADDLDTGAVSCDQLAAQRLGTLTPLPSLELGCDAPRSGIDVAGGGFASMALLSRGATATRLFRKKSSRSSPSTACFAAIAHRSRRA
jgi:hypothetical protein